MQITGLSWLGTRTDRFDEMVNFAKSVLGLEPSLEEEGVALFDLPNGDQFEVFSPEHHGGGHPASGVAGAFTVADVEAARAELLAAGIEVGEAQTAMGYVWAYLTAPDGNAYLVISKPAGDSD